MKRLLLWLNLLLWANLVSAERINQEGRILGSLPVVTNSILFNITNADAVVSAMQIFPVTNPWNEDVSHLPLLANSDAMIAEIMADLSSSRRTLRAFQEMNFALVPDNQPRQSIYFFNYADQSDLDGGSLVTSNGLYPIPTNLPIETWPSQTGTETLAQWQMDEGGGDRHSIMVEPGAGFIWETWETLLTGTDWEASNGAKFNLNSNGLRPGGWTSGDAAGLPMFPALVRYDEAERGMVEHACRLVVEKSRYTNYLYPATHYAASAGNTNVNIPSMGQRLRLKAGFSIPANWTKEEKAILLGLKKYGALVADNGGFFSISVTPDDRWPADCFDDLSSVSITNFEVVQSTGPNEGPRSPNAPAANAGADRSVAPGVPVSLQGFVTFTNSPPTIVWKQYSGPGAVTFGNTSLTNTTAIFSAPGIYTLRLSAADNVHAVAYDAVVFTVSSSISLSITRNSTNINLTWAGGSSPYIVQQTAALQPTAWSNVLTTSNLTATLPVGASNTFFRIQGH